MCSKFTVVGGVGGGLPVLVRIGGFAGIGLFATPGSLLADGVTISDCAAPYTHTGT
jgi:hypothetical protein